MKLSQINKKNIKSFILGNINFYKDTFIGSAEHVKEQYLYRMSLCSEDCIITGQCKECSCPTRKKMWAPESNNCIYPDFMSGSKWKTYKKENNINIKKKKKILEDV